MKNKIKACGRVLRGYASNTSGATAVEYGVMVAVLSVSLISAYKLMASGQNSMWSELSNKFSSAN